MRCGQQSSDGWLLAALHFACSEFGWTVGYACDEVSLTMILLLVRQKLNVEGKIGLTLADKQRIDTMDWDTLVAESHKRVANLKI